MSGARRFFWCVLRLGFAYPKKYKLEKEHYEQGGRFHQYDKVKRLTQ